MGEQRCTLDTVKLAVVRLEVRSEAVQRLGTCDVDVAVTTERREGR